MKRSYKERSPTRIDYHNGLCAQQREREKQRVASSTKLDLAELLHPTRKAA